MIPALFFSQLVLVALVWLCLMLQWVWPSDRVTAQPTPPPPTPPRRKRRCEPTPLWASPPSRTAMPVTKRMPPTRERLSAPPPQIILTRGPPPSGQHLHPFLPQPDLCVSRLGRLVTSAPMAIPMAVPGGNCCASPVAVIFSRPSARSFMASAPPSSSSCVSSRAWLRAWASGDGTGVRGRGAYGAAVAGRRGGAAAAFSQHFLHDVRVRQVQLDELFALLSAVKDGAVSETEAIERLERSPQWVWAAMDPEQAAAGGRRRESHSGADPTRYPSRGAGVGP